MDCNNGSHQNSGTYACFQVISTSEHEVSHCAEVKPCDSEYMARSCAEANPCDSKYKVNRFTEAISCDRGGEGWGSPQRKLHSQPLLNTEVILATTELESKEEAKNDTNRYIVDEFLDESGSIQNEICRGHKLRAEKPRHNETITSLDVLESFVNETRARKNNKRPGPTPRLRCPCGRPNSFANILRPICVQTKAKKGKRCPLRIAELAVPSKRQCIGTWREKCNVLPGFMVERLKQHVMDQVPIVKIPEAIYCFQREKRVSSKKWLACKKKQYEALKCSRQMDSRMLCILFAHRVAKRLSRPLKLNLDSDLEKLSKVVSIDIAKMMYKCQGSYNKDCTSAIHRDVTNQITFWITGILEDLSVKLLEDDLKAKMRAETMKGNMEEFCKPFVALTKRVINKENRVKLKDLEEEEGPVLDFIDDVVDNVMKVCKPPQLQIDAYSSDLSSSTQDMLEEESEKSHEYTDSETTKFHETFNSEVSIPAISEEADDVFSDTNKDMSSTEHFRNEISNIINNITKESGDIVIEIQKGSRDDIRNEEISLKSEVKHDINVGSNEVVSTKAEIDTDINDENITRISLDEGTERDRNVENKDEILLKEGKKDITNDENFDQINATSSNVNKYNETNDNADETHSNVSERFEIINDDYETVLVNAVSTAEKTSTTEELKFNQHKQTQWNYENNKPNIVFSAPNQDLISDADESWPTNAGVRPILKVSDSASKSISSLGRITEHDENIIFSPEEDEKSVADKEMGDTRLKVNAVIEILDTMLPDRRLPDTGKHDTASQASEPLTKETIESSSSYNKQVGSNEKKKFPNGKDISKTNNFPEPNIDKTGGKSSKLEKHQRDSELIRKGSKADGTEVDKICRYKKLDLGWKVHPKTAPSWVHAWGQGRGEPSDDSIPMQDRPTKVTENELRTWCKELEKAFINLEIWSDWISTTCEESLCILKQKQLACPGLARKGAIRWYRLKRNVHKDALVWTKLYQRTHNNFKSLKRKYNNVEYSEPTPISTNMIFETMHGFEDLRVDLHKMIVAAEYCAMCTCVKTKNRLNSNMDCRDYSSK